MDVILKVILVSVFMSGFGYVYFKLQSFNRKAIELNFKVIENLSLDINFLKSEIRTLYSNDFRLKRFADDNLLALNTATNLLYSARRISVFNRPLIMNHLIIEAQSIKNKVQDAVDDRLKSQRVKII